MKVTKFFRWVKRGIIAVYHGIRHMSRSQERILLLTLVVLSWVISARNTANNAEQIVAMTTPQPVIVEEIEPIVAAPSVNEDAEAVAKVLYGIRNNDTEELEAVVWCIVNRVESPLYPDTVVDVCIQPSQWMGYYDDNPVLDNLYDVACSVLDKWESGGHRPFGTEYLYLTWTPDQIILRTSFEENASCRYYRAG